MWWIVLAFFHFILFTPLKIRSSCTHRIERIRLTFKGWEKCSVFIMLTIQRVLSTRFPLIWAFFLLRILKINRIIILFNCILHMCENMCCFCDCLPLPFMFLLACFYCYEFKTDLFERLIRKTLIQLCENVHLFCCLHLNRLRIPIGIQSIASSILSFIITCGLRCRSFESSFFFSSECGKKKLFRRVKFHSLWLGQKSVESHSIQWNYGNYTAHAIDGIDYYCSTTGFN